MRGVPSRRFDRYAHLGNNGCVSGYISGQTSTQFLRNTVMQNTSLCQRHAGEVNRSGGSNSDKDPRK